MIRAGECLTIHRLLSRQAYPSLIPDFAVDGTFPPFPPLTLWDRQECLPHLCLFNECVATVSHRDTLYALPENAAPRSTCAHCAGPPCSPMTQNHRVHSPLSSVSASRSPPCPALGRCTTSFLDGMAVGVTGTGAGNGAGTLRGTSCTCADRADVKTPPRPVSAMPKIPGPLSLCPRTPTDP